MKKSLLFLVVFALLWGGVATVQARTYSGECGADGANVTWKLDTETGLLEISGTGAMKDNASSVSSRAPWYNYRSYITSVTIGEGVTSIGKRAFMEANLTKITIPNTVTVIGDEAFYNCNNLTSVTIGDGVTSIGDWAFGYCKSLTSVTIPESVTTIGNYAFYYCESLTSVTIGKSVTAIGNYAFQYCKSLTSVTIGDGVTAIGSSAFKGCTSLASVTIPESVTTIGESAFSDCTGLTSVTIGDGVTTISESAFYGCTGLTSVTIGKSVTAIGNYAFQYCESLTSVTIPESVTSIGNYAFNGCSGLTLVTIGKSVTSIGNGAFRSCSGLTSVTIPNSVTSIGNYAFDGCSGLTSVTIGNGVTSIANRAFYGCTGLKNLRIEDGTKTLVLSTTSTLSPFSDCPLETVYLGRNISYDGDYSPFRDKTTLVSLTIGNQVTAIGDGAFSGCTGLKEFKGKFTSSDHRCLVINGYLKAFAPSGLSSYTIPNEVITIDNTAGFPDYLTSVTISDNTYLDDGAFNGCTKLKSVTISNPTIHYAAFFGSGLEKFEGKFASKDNRCLVVNDTLRLVAPSGLTQYTIPDGVTVIDENAFYCCRDLWSITIPENVTSIRSNAFYACMKLRTVTPLSTTPPIIYNDAFNSTTYRNATVNCPKGTLRIYKNANGWKNFTYPTAEKVLNPKFINGTAGQTTYSFTFSYTRDIDYPVSKFYILTEGKEYLIDMDTTKSSIPVTLTDLEPQTEYKNIEFVIETVYGEKAAVSVTFTTDTVRFTTQPAINVSNTSATLTADIECDALTGAGFEWRRYDDPELVPSTFSETPIVDGKISGTLRNLSPEKYYKYRPFYRTAKGKYYYGAWLAFGTRDIYAYFEPTVSTRTGEVRGNTTTLSGYIVEGSDEIISQGFEYWAESPAGSTTAGEHKRVEGSGSLMNVTLTGLDYNTTYYYRAYATTAKKTTYGAIESFTTGENPNPSGIEETAAEDGFAVRLSGNPVRNGEIGVQVVGADGATWYRVISLHGAQIAQGVLSGTDEWQPVKIPAASTGHYLLQIIGSKGTKTLRIVVE